MSSISNSDQSLIFSQAVRHMRKIALAKPNDVVKLAFLDETQIGEIDKLDLTCLSEFKRSSAGVVEVKLSDRITVLNKLLDLMEPVSRSAIFDALEKSAEALEQMDWSAEQAPALHGCGEGDEMPRAAARQKAEKALA